MGWTWASSGVPLPLPLPYLGSELGEALGPRVPGCLSPDQKKTACSEAPCENLLFPNVPHSPTGTSATLSLVQGTFPGVPQARPVKRGGDFIPVCLPAAGVGSPSVLGPEMEPTPPRAAWGSAYQPVLQPSCWQVTQPLCALIGNQLKEQQCQCQKVVMRRQLPSTPGTS